MASGRTYTKYTSTMLREVKGKNGKRFKAVLKYKEDGKWRQVSKTFGAEVRTKTQANKALQQWRDQMEDEASKPVEAKQTMYQLVSAYVDRREALSKSANWDTTATLTNNEKVITRSTIRDYHHTLSYLDANFPKTELSDLKPLDVLEWEEGQLKAGHSLSRVRKAHVLCKQALDDAVIRGYIEHSCMASLKAPKLGKHENNALSQEDARKLTAQLSTFAPSAATVGAMLALHCGLRGGEVCGHQWADVDFEERHIVIKQSVGIANGGKFLKGTKSESGNRVVWLDDYALDMLMACKVQTLKDRFDITKGFEELFVVGNLDGDFLSPTTLSRQFTAISKAFGLRGKTGEVPTLHKLRHTFKDALMGGNGLGEHSEIISDVMGHSRKGITGAYGTRNQELMDEAVKAAAKWLAPKSGTKAKADMLTFDKTGTTD